MLENLIAERRKKLKRLKEAGINPYPARVARTAPIGEIRGNFAELSQSGKPVMIAGRIVGMRGQGGVAFFDLQDETGKLQAVAKKDTFTDFDLWIENLDIGDFISAEGPLFTTKREEKSVDVQKVTLLTKSLRPIPSEHFGIEDTETRLRKRYLDLLVNPELRELFRKKSIFWDTFRQTLRNEGFLEVETPVLEQIPGGAEAEPFLTHHNALDEDFYLRISLELPLKRLIVGGYNNVFEIGRIFRNEGIDAEHLQDYTQLEFYWAFHDYGDLMKLIERVYKQVIQNTVGSLKTPGDTGEIDWEGEWPKVDYVEAFKASIGLDPLSASRDELFQKAKGERLSPKDADGKGRLIDMLFKSVRHTLIQPCFLIDPPVEIEPLAKRSSKDPRRVERFQVVACGTELGKGFSELNDPLDQRARFEEQMKLREAGDKEAQQLDEDFLEALEYGMPPTAGFGVSERLFAILMNKPIRECVFFPPMRKKNN